MKLNKWTQALAALGVIGLTPAVQAEEQSAVNTALSSTTLSGYVDTSVNWRIGSPVTGAAIPGRSFDGVDKLNGFNLNAVKLVLEKPIEGDGWVAGYKVDLVFGPDASYFGSLLNGGATDPANEFAVKQAYAALRAPIGNGLDIKFGVFDTVIGYEVFESGNNPNMSRSYAYGLEPWQHTGLLLSYPVLDNVSISAGVVDSWTGVTNGRNNVDTDRLAFLGSITITLPDSAGPLAGSALYAGIVHGANGATAGGIGATGAASPEATSYYVGTTINTPLEGLSAGLAFDYREDGPVVGNNYAYAGALYLSFQATEKLKLNTRAEYAQASIGTFTTSAGDAADHHQLGALTFTADYSLWASVITRAELRWDKDLGNDNAFGAAGGRRENSALSVAGNVIYKF